MAHDHTHHVQPKALYVRTFVILGVLMVLTIVAALIPYQIPGFQNSPMGSWVNNLVAMGIATAKALIVITIFMGVKFATDLTKIYAILGFAWVTLMLVMFCDYATRDWEPVKGWEEVPANAFPRGKKPDPADPRAAETRDFGRMN
jgi:cytochrome c oxidase subunit 4